MIFPGLMGGAPAAASGVLHVWDGVALAATQGVPNTFSNGVSAGVPNTFPNGAQAAARGVRFAGKRRGTLRMVFSEQAFPRLAPAAAHGGRHFWYGEHSAGGVLRSGVAPAAANSGWYFLHAGKPGVATLFLMGVAGTLVPNKEPNDVNITQTPVLSDPRLNPKCATDGTMMSALRALELQLIVYSL